MEEVLEADILAGEVRISVAAETLEAEPRVSAGEDHVSVALETSEAEVPTLAALDTSAVALCILVRRVSAFHHPERVTLR
jgi:hypothetical protein